MGSATTARGELAGASGILDCSVLRAAGRLATGKGQHAADREFGRFLRQRGFSPEQRRALRAITLARSAALLCRPDGPAAFLEQVEYSGRRLAKLGLSPAKVSEALTAYSTFLLAAEPEEGFYQARRAIDTVTALALNNAYYDVRYAETAAFYELFRAELESHSVQELLARSARILTSLVRADNARVFLLDNERRRWIGTAECSAATCLAAPGILRAVARPRCIERPARAGIVDPGWPARYATVWSVPLSRAGRTEGVMQFAFARRYPWLPRERDLLVLAGERCLLGAEKARLTEDLARSNEEVRRLAAGIIQVEEFERRRISRELHDEAGQSLLCMRLQLEMLEKTAPPELSEQIGQVRTQAEQTIHNVRRLIADLSPTVLERFGLGAAVRQLVVTLRNLHGLKVDLKIRNSAKLPQRTELAAYRLLQECCNNAVKHASAEKLKISLVADDKFLRLTVEDDGRGFNTTAALERKGSFGLTGMKERVALLGGVFRLESGEGPGKNRTGTRVRVDLPVPEEKNG